MAWSKVNKPFKKPLGWWYHKIMCEFGYWWEKEANSVTGMRIYYNHLNIMCNKYHINLYGENFN